MKLADGLKEALQEHPTGFEAGGGPTIPCRVAVVVMESAKTRADRLNLLMFVLAVIALGAVIAAIVLFFVIDDATAQGLITLVGGLLTGVVAKFIRDEREDAVADRDAAHGIVNEQCNGQTQEQVLSAMELQAVS